MGCSQINSFLVSTEINDVLAVFFLISLYCSVVQPIRFWSLLHNDLDITLRKYKINAVCFIMQSCFTVISAKVNCCEVVGKNNLEKKI